jgi:cyclic pyranopterin phosphate synthase
MSAETLALVRDKKSAKGDVLEVARLAGIMAAKRTAELIPLCHILPLESVTIDFDFAGDTSLQIVATVQVEAKTGVEMEALTAVSVTALTVYDMCKSVDRGMAIGPIQLEEKTGGRSGHWRRENPKPACFAISVATVVASGSPSNSTNRHSLKLRNQVP